MPRLGEPGLAGVDDLEGHLGPVVETELDAAEGQKLVALRRIVGLLALEGQVAGEQKLPLRALPLKTARIGFSNGSRVRETKPTTGMSCGRLRNVPIPETSASKTPSRSRSTSSTRVSLEKLTFGFS